MHVTEVFGPGLNSAPLIALNGHRYMCGKERNGAAGAVVPSP